MTTRPEYPTLRQACNYLDWFVSIGSFLSSSEYFKGASCFNWLVKVIEMLLEPENRKVTKVTLVGKKRRFLIMSNTVACLGSH